MRAARENLMSQCLSFAYACVHIYLRIITMQSMHAVAFFPPRIILLRNAACLPNFAAAALNWRVITQLGNSGGPIGEVIGVSKISLTRRITYSCVIIQPCCYTEKIHYLSSFSTLTHSIIHPASIAYHISQQQFPKTSKTLKKRRRS